MKKCCRNCVHCKYIKTPLVTGNPIDFVCELKGAIIDNNNIDIKNCDEMYKPKVTQ